MKRADGYTIVLVTANGSRVTDSLPASCDETAITRARSRYARVPWELVATRRGGRAEVIAENVTGETQ